MSLKRWRRPPISRFEVLVALFEAPRPAFTDDVLEQVPAHHTRRQVYYRLAQLEQSGYVDKELIFGQAIAHASWSLTDKGLAAVRREETSI